MLEWLLDADNRELDDAIEMVNEKMLVKLLEKTQFMAVFFCKYSGNVSSYFIRRIIAVHSIS